MPRITVSDDKIRAKLTYLKGLAGADIKDLVGDVGRHARDAIRERTSRGESLDGGGFAPYSKSYEKKRIKSGLTVIPNLSFTGKMMTALRWRREGKNSIKLGFENASDRKKAGYNHYGTGTAQARPFFGLNEKDRKSIIKIINARFRAILG